MTYELVCGGGGGGGEDQSCSLAEEEHSCSECSKQVYSVQVQSLSIDTIFIMLRGI